jgi:hypothetical protein
MRITRSVRRRRALRPGLAPFRVDVRLTDLYLGMYAAADGYVTSQPLDASDPEHLQYAFELAGADCTAIITNTPHNTDEACAIVSYLIALAEGQLFGEILCCWRPRWILGTKKSPMHAYAWYVWRNEARSGPSFKLRVGRRETIAALSAFT